ncbi:MAG TPA: M28 family peptidase [Pirellulaceae bacterium]
MSATAKAHHSRRSHASSWPYYALAGFCTLALIALALYGNGTTESAQRPTPSKQKTSNIPFNGDRAYQYLKDICAIGPRVSGTEGMARQQAYLKAHFEKLGGRVSLPEFTARHPQTGNPVKLANMIVEWHPDRKERVLFCAHYDTRPFPDQDPVDRRGLFVGANDGASGTAVLCELGNEMAQLKTGVGVDFILFDGEELVFDGNRDPYFLGSEHFAREYVAHPPPYRYRAGILLDMVGDAQLQLYREVNSLRTPQSKQLTNDIWNIARDLGVREFLFGQGHEVRDDHLALNDIAKIPTTDLIDFDYPNSRGVNYWHTTQDIPEKCSPASLAKVGWVLKTWLEQQK